MLRGLPELLLPRGLLLLTMLRGLLLPLLRRRPPMLGGLLTWLQRTLMLRGLPVLLLLQRTPILGGPLMLLQRRPMLRGLPMLRGSPLMLLLPPRKPLKNAFMEVGGRSRAEMRCV